MKINFLRWPGKCISNNYSVRRTMARLVYGKQDGRVKTVRVERENYVYLEKSDGTIRMSKTCVRKGGKKFWGEKLALLNVKYTNGDCFRLREHNSIPERNIMRYIERNKIPAFSKKIQRQPIGIYPLRLQIPSNGYETLIGIHKNIRFKYFKFNCQYFYVYHYYC